MIPWKRRKAIVNCPYSRKDIELFVSLCILIVYGKDHLPDDFRLPMDIPLAIESKYGLRITSISVFNVFDSDSEFTVIKKGSRITPFILDAIKSRIPKWIQEIEDAEKAYT